MPNKVERYDSGELPAFRSYAVGYQIIARSFYRSSVHELEMMNLVRDGRSKAKHKRRARKYQDKAADAYAKAQKAVRDSLRYDVKH